MMSFGWSWLVTCGGADERTWEWEWLCCAIAHIITHRPRAFLSRSNWICFIYSFVNFWGIWARNETSSSYTCVSPFHRLTIPQRHWLPSQLTGGKFGLVHRKTDNMLQSPGILVFFILVNKLTTTTWHNSNGETKILRKVKNVNSKYLNCIQRKRTISRMEPIFSAVKTIRSNIKQK